MTHQTSNTDLREQIESNLVDYGVETLQLAERLKDSLDTTEDLKLNKVYVDAIMQLIEADKAAAVQAAEASHLRRVRLDKVQNHVEHYGTYCITTKDIDEYLAQLQTKGGQS